MYFTNQPVNGVYYTQQYIGNEFANGDRIGNLYYTSFEASQQQPNYPPAIIYRKAMIDPPLAASFQPVMKEIAISPNNAITFYGNRHYLSSFFEAPMLISGYMYPTVEHYYQACKVYALCGAHEAVTLQGIRDARVVKKVAASILIKYRKGKKEQDRWKTTDGLIMVRIGVSEKFRQHPGLLKRFLKTGEKLLMQANQYDNTWSTGMNSVQAKEWLVKHQGETIKYPALVDSNTVASVPMIGKGKNLLGFLMMHVRDYLRVEFGVAPLEKAMVNLNLKGKKSDYIEDDAVKASKVTGSVVDKKKKKKINGK